MPPNSPGPARTPGRFVLRAMAAICFLSLSAAPISTPAAL
jgi:hypothetical protein